MPAQSFTDWQPIESAPSNEMVLIATTGLGALSLVIAHRRAVRPGVWIDQYGKPLPPSWAPGWWMRLPVSPLHRNEREPARS
jgi:hypothetical protein